MDPDTTLFRCNRRSLFDISNAVPAKSNVDDNPDSGGAVWRKAFTFQEQSNKIYLPSGVEHWAPSPQKLTIFLGVIARTGNTDSQSNPSFYGYRKYIRHNEVPGLFNIVTHLSFEYSLTNKMQIPFAMLYKARLPGCKKTIKELQQRCTN